MPPNISIKILILLLTVSLQLNAADALKWESLPEKSQYLVDNIIEINKALEPELDKGATRDAFMKLLNQTASKINKTDSPLLTIKKINESVLMNRQVSYLQNKYWRDCSFAASLQRKKGNCFSTTLLYVSICRALDLPVYACFVPEHVFACWSDGRRRINIETTDKGTFRDTYHFLTRFEYNHKDMKFYEWMRPASDEKLLAEFNYVAAKHLYGQREFDKALERIDKVISALPHRLDFQLDKSRWLADKTGQREDILKLAKSITNDESSAPGAQESALWNLCHEYNAKLDRKNQRDVLLRLYGITPWHKLQNVLGPFSICLRGLRDYKSAVLCMELAVARDPDNLQFRSWLAVLLAEADRTQEGLEQIKIVRNKNPESETYAAFHAGLLVKAGQRKEGKKLFDSIKAPRDKTQLWEINVAGFYAIWGDEKLFYPKFESLMKTATDPSILSWIEEDRDLDKFRKDPKFKRMVRSCRKRLASTSK